ncbi:hypothetical protein GEMRC1_010843 [Eukaryota sp. GEM-RC1]
MPIKPPELPKTLCKIFWEDDSNYQHYDLHLKYSEYVRSSKFFYSDVRRIYLKDCNECTSEGLLTFLAPTFRGAAEETNTLIPDADLKLSSRNCLLVEQIVADQI